MTALWTRWAPAAAAVAVIAVGTVAATAAPNVDLPDKTPAELIELAAGSSVQAFSGTVEQSSEMGLPELPDERGFADAADALEFLTSSHTARVWVDAPERGRVQLLDTLAERGAVKNGSELWLYSSEEEEVTHVTLPAGGLPEPSPGPTLTPNELADRLLADLDSSTAVTAGDDTRVAGRTAYQLVLTPRTDDTLVDSVVVALDSETGFPLSFAVHATGQAEPALAVAFSSVSFETPTADTFAYTPPAGATVEELSAEEIAAKLSAGGHSAADHPLPLVTGSDWATVVELPAGALPAEALASPLLAQVTQVVDGGRLFSTALFSVLVTDDGRVFAGAVPATTLQAAVAAR
ncbi:MULTISPECIES: DUF2092 domain-containing protein [unclassified Diaminobutyricimonas]|uniref:LolA family protein n=1 Tax=unclassified Diaminobutyricimonas TaxID=2643261 RepID=UPI0012F4BCE9|nr:MULTISPECIES: DUF2092 domain-containing protein [unclassified Diaminobutyricimonas]